MKEHPAPKRTSPISNPQAASDELAPGHRNPYYKPETTQQDPLAVPKAFGLNTEEINPEQYQSNVPLGAENIDMKSLNIEAMQVENEDVSNFVQQLSSAITEKPAPGAMPTLEEQILVLQFIGADPRQIAALQDKLDAQNAAQFEKAQAAAKEAEKPSTNQNTVNAAQRQERIFIDAHEILAQTAMNDISERSRPSYAKSQVGQVDPFPESVSAAHASRLPGSGPLEDEPLFRHDPLQNLPEDKSATLARSRSSNPDIIRVVPGLATADQIDQIVRSTSLMPSSPITNPTHIQYLRTALKEPVTRPIQSNERSFKSRISSRPKAL